MHYRISFISFIYILIIICCIYTSGITIAYPNCCLHTSKVENIIYIDNTNQNGPWDGSIDYPFKYIQDGINNANENDTIYILAGRYNETLTIQKRIILNGQNTKQTIINGEYQPHIITILKDKVKITNITIQHSGGMNHNAGILLNSSHNTISHCQFYQTKSGIIINNQSENIIKNCIFNKNGEGIFLYRSHKITIQNCNLYQNGLGVHIAQSNTITITNTTAHTNGIGFYMMNSSYLYINKCAAYNNNDNQGGFFTESSHHIILNNSIIAHNGFGLKTSNSHSIDLIQSTILYNTHAGLLITDTCYDLNVSSCEIIKNLRISISIQNSNISLYQNNIANSICGIYAEYSHCNAENNWWGSPFGPSIIERKQRDNIKKIKSSIDTRPWSIQRYHLNGADWTVSTLFDQQASIFPDTNQIIFKENDTDRDGVPDWWEQIYGYNPLIPDTHYKLDPDNDGLSNIEECYTHTYGSHPYHKDIFLEFDWMECRTHEHEMNKPSQDYIQKAKDIYAKHNITLHIDVGTLGGGEQVPYADNFFFADLRDYYWNYFLHHDVHNPRKGIFHYGLICDYGPASGFAFIGLDNLDGFCISADILQTNHQVSYPRQRFIIGASLHELGHHLGLTVDDHRGNDNKISTLPFSFQWFKYLTYPSCMNYFYTYFFLGYSDGSHGPGDFDDWSHMDLSFFKTTHFILPELYR